MNFFILVVFGMTLIFPANISTMYHEILKAPSFKYPKDNPMAFLDNSYKVLISVASMRGLFESTYTYEKEDINVKDDLLALSTDKKLTKEQLVFVADALSLLDTKEILICEYLDLCKGKQKKIMPLYGASEKKEQLVILDWVKKVYGLTLKADMLLLDFDTYCEKEYKKEVDSGEIDFNDSESIINYFKKQSDFISIRTHASAKVAELHHNIVSYEEFFLESIDKLIGKEKAQAKIIKKEFFVLQEKYYAYLDIFYAPLRKIIEESL